MKDNKPVTDKRLVLIEAIVNKDIATLQSLIKPNKRIVILNSFLDCLKYSSTGQDDTVELLLTDNCKQMWHEIESRSTVV